MDNRQVGGAFLAVFAGLGGPMIPYLLGDEPSVFLQYSVYSFVAVIGIVGLLLILWPRRKASRLPNETTSEQVGIPVGISTGKDSRDFVISENHIENTGVGIKADGTGHRIERTTVVNRPDDHSE